MSVQDQISNDIKEAMKARNVDKLAALRAVKSAIMLEATKDGSTTVSDEMSLQIIAKLVKQRKDSAAIFTEQNRPDLAVDEINQLAYLEEYLPTQMGEEEVRSVVKEVIAQVGASSPADMGKCMSPLMGKWTFTRRQDLPKIIALNGAVYIAESDFFQSREEEDAFLTVETVGYVMPKSRSLDIDTEDDMKLCEVLLKQRQLTE